MTKEEKDWNNRVWHLYAAYAAALGAPLAPAVMHVPFEDMETRLLQNAKVLVQMVDLMRAVEGSVEGLLGVMDPSGDVLSGPLQKVHRLHERWGVTVARINTLTGELSVTRDTVSHVRDQYAKEFTRAEEAEATLVSRNAELQEVRGELQRAERESEDRRKLLVTEAHNINQLNQELRTVRGAHSDVAIALDATRSRVVELQAELEVLRAAKDPAKGGKKKAGQ